MSIIANNWQTRQFMSSYLVWRQIKELAAMEYITTHKKQDTEEDSDENIFCTMKL